MKIISGFLSACALALIILHCAAGAHDLSQEYAFSAVLDDAGDYQLYWSFDLSEKTISFAVNVSTTGWVGFGLSPNGQMPGSDVVIGWVDSTGNTFFQDRFAVDRYLPPIDASQDWTLISGEEEDGYTILEFTRDLTTCDEFDLNVEADTARIVWSYNSEDPSDPSSVMEHDEKGSASINLLGGLVNGDKDRPGSKSFAIANENLTIPTADTTYWCSVHELPSAVLERERYIYKFSPIITPETTRYVHHIVLYVCDSLNLTNFGSSGVCEDAHVNVQLCRGTGTVLGAWAVGGQDFIMPDGVAYPVGGPDHPRYVVLEMHYDNPDMDAGNVDSSGMEFIYTDVEPEHLAATLTVGNHPNPTMIIPPNLDNFVIAGVCHSQCTENFVPEEGLTVFGSLLHTHLAGHGLITRHFRQNQECGVLEELPPIDTNLKYDFNYQQVNLLPQTATILPGDTVVVECFYRTTHRTDGNVTLGGESTREEMCLDFLYYYPRIELSYCGSAPSIPQSYQPFVDSYVDPADRGELYNGIAYGDSTGVERVMNNVPWSPEAVAMLQQTYYSNITSICYNNVNVEQSSLVTDEFPVSACEYEAPDICTGTEPLSCCDRLSGAPPLKMYSGYLVALLLAVLTISLAF